MGEQITPLQASSLTAAQVIDSRINAKFIADYGVVVAISSDKTKVDVKSAVLGVLMSGDTLPPYTTYGVELLYPASANFSMQYPVSVGDGVLLLGLKNYVQSTLNVQPTAPNGFSHYSQDTFKAIPLSAIPGSSSVKVSVDASGNYTIHVGGSGNLQLQAESGLIQLKNTAYSLKTIMDSFMDAVKNANVTIIATVAAAPGPVTVTSATIDAATQATITTLKANIDALLEA